MDIAFRLAELADIEALVAYMRDFYAIDAYPFVESVARRALRELLEHPAYGHVWLIEQATQPIGYLVLTFGYSLEFHGRNALVDELYVRPESRHQGVGRAAMEHVIAECRAAGIAAIHLEVERHNTAGRALYRDLGFTDHDRYFMTLWTER